MSYLCYIFVSSIVLHLTLIFLPFFMFLALCMSSYIGNKGGLDDVNMVNQIDELYQVSANEVFSVEF